MSDRRQGSGGVERGESRQLENGGPALRVVEPRHPAGPAFDAQLGSAMPIIEGPADEEPQLSNGQTASSARREFIYGGVAVALLLLVAAASFWTSGSARADSLLQALGVAFVAVAAGSVALGMYFSRTD